jgi:hypothetical protein
MQHVHGQRCVQHGHDNTLDLQEATRGFKHTKPDEAWNATTRVSCSHRRNFNWLPCEHKQRLSVPPQQANLNRQTQPSKARGANQRMTATPAANYGAILKYFSKFTEIVRGMGCQIKPNSYSRNVPESVPQTSQSRTAGAKHQRGHGFLSQTLVTPSYPSLTAGPGSKSTAHTHDTTVTRAEARASGAESHRYTSQSTGYERNCARTVVNYYPAEQSRNVPQQHWCSCTLTRPR